VTTTKSLSDNIWI